jgi:hypothetical protein
MKKRDAGKIRNRWDKNVERRRRCEEEDIGVLCSGKRFRQSRKMIVVDREERNSEVKERYIGVVLHIEGISWSEENERDH